MKSLQNPIQLSVWSLISCPVLKILCKILFISHFLTWPCQSPDVILQVFMWSYKTLHEIVSICVRILLFGQFNTFSRDSIKVLAWSRKSSCDPIRLRVKTLMPKMLFWIFMWSFYTFSHDPVSIFMRDPTPKLSKLSSRLIQFICALCLVCFLHYFTSSLSVIVPNSSILLG